MQCYYKLCRLIMKQEQQQSRKAQEEGMKTANGGSPHNYDQEYLSINFQPNYLIDLIDQQPNLMSANSISNYSQFLKDRVIEVEKPQLIKEGYLTSYKLYKIRTKKRGADSWETVVNRRFNDFEYLHFVLVENYGGYVLPHLPNKNFLASLNLQTKEFQEGRVCDLKKYVQRLMNHPQVKFSRELRWFLFDEEYQFSSEKGQFIEQTGALSGIKALTENVIMMGKSLLSKYMMGSIHKSEVSKQPLQEAELGVFSQQIEDLMQVTKEIKSIISYSYQELEIVKEFIILPCEAKDLHKKMQYLIQEFQQIAEFIENCFQAITRTKKLKQDLERLQEQEVQTALKENEKPRSRQLDALRSKLSKYRLKYQRWTRALKQELSTYTQEGKTLMQSFVKRFIIERNRIYALWTHPSD